MMHAHTDIKPPALPAKECCAHHVAAVAPVAAAGADAIYTCPMHPEIQQKTPGACPKCGMALEAVLPVAAAVNHELIDMKRRFWVAALLSAPLFAFEMGHHAGLAIHLPGWVQAVLAAPVVAWCGWPFFTRAAASVVNRHLNMFTLIALGTGVSYIYSVAALNAPELLGDALYFESAAVITALVLLGQVLELKAREKTGAALQALLNLAPKTARLVAEDGSENTVALASVAVGDRLRVRAGESVPVDGVITEGDGDVNQAMVTGEPLPVAKKEGDDVIGGTISVQGSFIMQARAVGNDTVLARIAAMVAKAQRTRAPIQQLADKVSGIFVPAVLAVAALTALGWMVFGPGVAEAVNHAVAVLIIACPCALGLATPVAIVIGTGRGASAGVLVRHAEAMERLEKADTLVMDKTGTLTLGVPKLLNIMPTEGHSETNLLRLAASLEQNSAHPLSLAIVNAAKERQIGLLKTHAFRAVAGQGITGIVDGRSVAMGSEALLESLHIPASLRTKAQPYRSQGQTVIFVAMDQHCIGLLMLGDAVKDNAVEVLKEMKQLGLQPVMMTGDSKATAMAVARKVGIEQVEADVAPERKAELVMALQAKGHKVAMAGDGVNDAPALAQAEVGIAMGTGTDVAMESAGITLLHGDLMGLVRARRLSMAVMRVVRQNLVLAFGYNVLAIPLAAGVFAHWGVNLRPEVAAAAMAASSLSVIGNSLRLRGVALG
jgi:Cu+-exporting ATPase